MAGAAGSFSTFGGGGHFGGGIGSGSKRHGANDQEDQGRFTRCKPESIEKLCRTTRFSKEELQIIYRGYKQQCPNGFLKEETLKNIFASFFPQGDSSEYAHYVFLTLDTDRTGSISFEKFIWTLSLLSRGTVEEKLRWIFQLYDVDGDGFIAKEELVLVATSIYHLMGKWTRPSFTPENVEEHIDAVLKKMNADDGYVPYPNFLNYCLGDRAILDSMKSLDTLISGGHAAPPLQLGGNNNSGSASNKPFTIDESPMESEFFPTDDVFQRSASTKEGCGGGGGGGGSAFLVASSTMTTTGGSGECVSSQYGCSVEVANEGDNTVRIRSSTTGSNASTRRSRLKALKDFF